MQDRLHLLRSVPMLILWGMKDFVFDHHFLDEWVRRFPDAEVHRFPEAGHYLFEDEAEAINGLVRAFLAAHPAHRGACRLSRTLTLLSSRSNIAIHLSCDGHARAAHAWPSSCRTGETAAAASATRT